MENSTAERARAVTGADVFVGDVAAAPFAEGFFDAITCFDVFEPFTTHVSSSRELGGG